MTTSPCCCGLSAWHHLLHQHLAAPHQPPPPLPMQPPTPLHLLHPLSLLHLPDCFCLNLLILLVLVILVLLYSAVDVAVGVVIFMTFEGAASWHCQFLATVSFFPPLKNLLVTLASSPVSIHTLSNAVGAQNIGICFLSCGRLQRADPAVLESAEQVLLRLYPVHHAFDKHGMTVLGILASAGLLFCIMYSKHLPTDFLHWCKETAIRDWSLFLAFCGKQTNAMSCCCCWGSPSCQLAFSKRARPDFLTNPERCRNWTSHFLRCCSRAALARPGPAVVSFISM